MDLQHNAELFISRTSCPFSAGMPPAILLPGFPVGIVESPEYELEVINFVSGISFVYSDGAVEQMGPTGKQFGISSMQELNGNRAIVAVLYRFELAAVLNSTADGKSTTTFRWWE
ncbi:MAG: hypothetical protein R3C56_30965 [Pirellulaceae bacterium]